MIITEEPPYGYILAGEFPNQCLYERDGVIELERWLNVADEDDVYTFANLLADYKVLRWLIPSPLSAATSAT